MQATRVHTRRSLSLYEAIKIGADAMFAPNVTDPQEAMLFALKQQLGLEDPPATLAPDLLKALNRLGWRLIRTTPETL